DGRRHDLGVLRDGQRAVGEGAQDHRHDRNHAGEDRTVDEEVRQVHRQPPGWAAGGGGAIGRSSAVTGIPCRTRWVPATTTRSSGDTPSRMIRRPSLSGPSVTRRYCATPCASTTHTNVWL